jgi:predicted MFS family arabinose efflux permease
MVLPQSHRGDFPPVNAQKKFLAACFTIEGLNSFATVIYFNYLYFLFRDRFGFDNKHNLALAALIGLIYTLASWQGGRFAQRCGNFTVLKIGFGIMAAGLAVGSQLHFVAGAIAAACVVNVGMCFTWPVLEALVVEGANPARAVGIYNITWAAANALAYFIGGTLIVQFGYQSMFYLPLVFVLVQFAMVLGLEKIHGDVSIEPTHSLPPEAASYSPARKKSFQRMAWLANPFAYIAINTLLAVIPGLAAKFQMSPMLAGFVCSLWCFVRLGTFVLLWRWPAWHYRFRWLVTAFSALVLSFAAILIVPSLAVLVMAQIFFGVAIGLIYYSSLFYSMDASDTKSEHGGIHEAAIGAGNCIGPAVGAAALEFLPQVEHSGAIAVSVLLLCGLGGLVKIWKSAR